MNNNQIFQIFCVFHKVKASKDCHCSETSQYLKPFKEAKFSIGLLSTKLMSPHCSLNRGITLPITTTHHVQHQENNHLPSELEIMLCIRSLLLNRLSLASGYLCRAGRMISGLMGQSTLITSLPQLNCNHTNASNFVIGHLPKAMYCDSSMEKLHHGCMDSI